MKRLVRVANKADEIILAVENKAKEALPGDQDWQRADRLAREVGMLRSELRAAHDMVEDAASVVDQLRSQVQELKIRINRI